MGQVVAGRYELDREVGRGGMGSVWLARDTVLDRPVALKRIGVLPGTEQADLDRVEREARVSAMLHHEHVVSVFDLVADGTENWLVMEYVPSRTLAQVVRDDGPLSPDRTARLIAQVGAALAAAHRAGIVHRDVKPSNILVTDDDRVKLGDFGIARAAADSTLTQTGMVTGSPSYLAPEVAAGAVATPASDLWSLGASVFHAVTGSPPYDARDNVLGALYRIVHEEPPRTDRAGWLAPLLRSTMDRDPERRWSAEQVVGFLDGRGVDEPTVAAPVTTPLLATPAAAAPRTTAGHAATGGRRPGVVPLGLVGGLATLILVLLLAAWLVGRDRDNAPTTGPTDQPAQSPTSGEGTGESPDEGGRQPQPDADEMVAFAEDYLATVVGDPESAWPRLTPSFQAASGGYDSYSSFWNTIEDYDVSGTSADPEQMTVSYTVAYSVSGEGRRPPEDVTLELVLRDGDYLIDGER